jgi:hypothetical protein
MKKNFNDATLAIRLPEHIHDQLKALADAKFMPVSLMVRLMLIDYLKQEAPNALTTQTHPHTTPQNSPPNIARPLSPREKIALGFSPDEDWL